MVLETIKRFEPTLFFSAPTLYNAILNYPRRGLRTPSIRYGVSAAEALPAHVWRRWKETFGVTILDGIGSTEMLHSLSHPGQAQTGVQCANRARLRGQILDEEEYPVEEPDEAGYLSVKGDSAAAYYWRNHEKTKETMKGEWLFAGDWYRVDEDGFYWYEGRADDMIKVSGLWVSPVEVENTGRSRGGSGSGSGRSRRRGADPQRPTSSCVKITRAPTSWSRSFRSGLRTTSNDTSTRIVEFIEELPKTTTGKMQRLRARAGVGERYAPTRRRTVSGERRTTPAKG